MLLGEHLRRNRQRSQARARLQSAVHAFDGLGASPWSARAGQELRAAGGQPGGAGHETSGDVSALTAQERAVTLAVASGMSNREVAEALFLSTADCRVPPGQRVPEAEGPWPRGACPGAGLSAGPVVVDVVAA